MSNEDKVKDTTGRSIDVGDFIVQAYQPWSNGPISLRSADVEEVKGKSIRTSHGLVRKTETKVRILRKYYE